MKVCRRPAFHADRRRSSPPAPVHGCAPRQEAGGTTQRWGPARPTDASCVKRPGVPPRWRPAVVGEGIRGRGAECECASARAFSVGVPPPRMRLAAAGGSWPRRCVCPPRGSTMSRDHNAWWPCGGMGSARSDGKSHGGPARVSHTPSRHDAPHPPSNTPSWQHAPPSGDHGVSGGPSPRPVGRRAAGNSACLALQSQG